MKPLVIYHANCADGFGAAFAAFMQLGDDAEYLPCKYGEQADTFDASQALGRDVYILDFSFNKTIMEALICAASNIVWLDHHKTAFEMWCPTERENYSLGTEDEGNVYIRLDNSKSGALIAWEYFHPNMPVPLMFQHIDDYDRWQFKLQGTKEYIRALWSYAPWTFEQWEDLWTLVNVKTLYAQGEAILRAHDQNVQAVVKSAARPCKIGGIFVQFTAEGEVPVNTPKEGLIANCPPHLTSDVGHELATQSGTYGLLWCMGTDDKIKCSLRSNGDYDVSAIAKTFGGGGHKNAAGFEVPLETLIGWMA